jgi:hypothetical protein
MKKASKKRDDFSADPLQAKPVRLTNQAATDLSAVWFIN